MDSDAIIGRLEAFGRGLPAVVGELSDSDVRWKPAPEHWSILEICCHLLDEEKEDFGLRLRSTLEDPSRAWPPLELEKVAERRSYNTRDLKATVAEFSRERGASVAWLRSLESPDWGRVYQGRKLGPISAGELLASWGAHDALHLRQVAKRLHGLAGRDGTGFRLEYAGEWTA